MAVAPAPLPARWHHGKPGFTLVELCVVLAVVGLLASIVWPSMHSQLQRSRRADAVTALMRVRKFTL